MSIHAAALDLAERDGWDAVTVDAIAKRADVGISTLYRYFTDKDATLLAPFASNVGLLAECLTARPSDEPLEIALGVALREFLDVTTSDLDALLRLRAQLDIAAGPRARLWDVWNQHRLLLEDAIAARSNRDVADLWVAMAAHSVMMIAQLVLDRLRDSVDAHAPREIAAAALELLMEGSFLAHPSMSLQRP